MRPLTRLLPLFALCALSAFGQPALQEKITVTYIEVPVTVIGRDGAPVRGLTKANFEIVDEGEKRAIDSFDAIDFAAAGAQKAISPLNPASRRNFLLLFDLSFSSPGSLGRAQEAARNFIARSLGNRDLVAVAAVDVDRGFRFLTAFTTDRGLLLAAIKDPRNFRAFDPLQISMAQLMNENSENPAAGGATDRGSSVADDIAADFQRTLNKMDESYRRARVVNQVDMLAQIARQLQRLAGQKHIVLLSEGFDPRLVEGRLAGETREQTEENGYVIDGELWKVDSDKRFGNASTQKAIAAMAESFRRSDVVLHALDIQGVRVQNDVQGGARVNSNEGLFLLANSTGGTVFRNSNDISGDFDRLARQHEVVYVLGFQAPAAAAGEFHDLKVRLVNVPGARVQHRGGYYGAGAESVVERTLSTAQVIVNDIPQDDIGLAAMATPFPTPDGKAQVPVILEIDGADLIANAKNNAATAEIFVYAFDEDGLVRDSMFQRMRLDMTKVADRLRQGGVKFYATLSLPPGKYAIKNLVRIAETDKKGYQRLDVSVPSADDVAVLQPLFFEDAGQWVMVKGGSSDKTNAPYPFVLDGESFVPAARASVRKGEPRLFTVWVYNAQPDELTWEIAPAAKLVSESRPKGSDVTKFVFALERVSADTRKLDVTIRKKGSSDARRVTVPLFPQ
jgi:VWFA-related protein